jgi:hypothetical protein
MQTMNQLERVKSGIQVAFAEWLTFPALAEVWAHSPEKTIAHLADRAAHYKSLSESAAPADRVRDRLIAVSYERVHALLEELYTAQHASEMPAEK